MPIYQYKARNKENKIVKDLEEAMDIADLRIKLKEQDLYLENAKVYIKKKVSNFFALSSRVKMQEIVTFIRQMAIMVEVGILVEDAIRTIRKQGVSSALKRVLIQVEDDLLKGMLLSEAFAKHPKVFPAYFKNMIHIGELSGNLNIVLNKVANYYERDRKIKQKAKNAMIYPSFLFVIIIIVFVFLTTQIMPKMEEMLMQLGGDLPTLTVVMLLISRFLQDYVFLMFIGILVFIFLIFLFFQTKKGKYVKDYLKLKIPFIKKVNYYLITTRFARGLGVLVSSGMNVMESIEMIGKLMDNKFFEKKFIYATDEIKSGKRISRSIDNLSFFPSMLIEMIAVGEQTGSLENVLEITANFYDETLEHTIEKTVAVLEPIMIIFAGLVVGSVILSIFLPLISITGSI